MGKYGGIVRSLAPGSWVWFQALLSLISAILVAVFVALGGVFWLFAVIVAVAFTALIAISSRERVATFPPHPLMVLALMRSAARASTVEDFQDVLSTGWSIDQTGKPSQVRAEVREAQQINVIALDGKGMILPLDDHSVVSVYSNVEIFRPADKDFWKEVWTAWQPALLRGLNR